MADQITRLSVFIASPGDLPEGERDIVRTVCASVNRMLSNRNIPFLLEPCGYETHVYPGVLDEHPQTDLTRLAEESDILIAIFHRRLGGAGQHSQSGTVEEIKAALARRKTTGTQPEILVYFRTVHEDLPGDDILEVNQFKNELHSRGDIRTEDYSDALHFHERLSEALMAYIEKLIPTQSLSPISIVNFADTMRDVPQPLLDWPYTINGEWMERPELVEIRNEIHRLIEDNPKARSATLLLGSPGTGKSALLSCLGKRLIEEGVSVFSIKADMIPSHIRSSHEMTEELHLPMETIDCLRRMRMNGPVVLIVDQLDAVSEIADRKSERLNLLLNLIKTASAMDGVHIVASCRIFEHRHDVRLATIDAKVITLQPPDWEEIGNILKKHGLDPSNLSQEIKELLEVPLHLKLFIEVLPSSDGRLDSFHTIQNLYEELWQQKIQHATNADQCARLIYQLAKWMCEEEDLWAPTSVADDFPQALQELEAEAIIVHEGRRVGFRHQTFFDFVLARVFAKGDESLTEHVLQRQDGLLVRPILLATLDRILRDG
ncbi:MAG TPA: AAA family ATPase [Candidatus Hodarchaeales archaeon]|nr:AAA family ATPase [Candidatus Hodarchaeales archaeon]